MKNFTHKFIGFVLLFSISLTANSQCDETLVLTSQGGNGGGSYGNWAWFAGDLRLLLEEGDIVYGSDGSAYTVGATINYNQNISQVLFSTNVAGVFTNGNSYNTASCTFEGCTDNTACNYDAIATDDDGSCTFAEEYYDCAGVCLADLDGDSVCDELEIVGCTDNTACNYDATATDDGSCAFFDECGVCNGDNSSCTDACGVINGDNSCNNLSLPEGWSMFGYTCLESLDVVEAFSSISDKIEIVKDEWGLSYIPSWEFNAIANLQFSEGYQIKMIEEVIGFQFCDARIFTQADINAVHELYEGYCLSDLDNDGICDENEISGCTSSWADNFNELASDEDGSCYKYGCTSSWADNYDETATDDDGSCEKLGCTDLVACNYDDLANTDDGTCEGIRGCTNDIFSEYNIDATCDDGSCMTIYGCFDEEASASPYYDPQMFEILSMQEDLHGYEQVMPIHDESMCGQAGCLNQQACNYDSSNDYEVYDLCEFPTGELDCNGNEIDVNTLQIGDYYAGGIVYILNGDGTGWVMGHDQFDVYIPRLGDWSDHVSHITSQLQSVNSSNYEGYEDWQLASSNDLFILEGLFAPNRCNNEDNIWDFNNEGWFVLYDLPISLPLNNHGDYYDSGHYLDLCDGVFHQNNWCNSCNYSHMSFRVVRAF